MTERKPNFQSLSLLAWVLNSEQSNQELRRFSTEKNSPLIIQTLAKTLSPKDEFDKAEKLIDLYQLKTSSEITSLLVKNKIIRELLETKSKMNVDDWALLKSSSSRSRIVLSKLDGTNE
ncbi:MAG: hypothetical protein NE334_00025 [Lentisphaeraceae bacterium]|nr:hypothetical protein [Lentisphaeraceae bacterium]